MVGWVEKTLEDWLGLKLNRTKTRLVNLNEEGTHLDFLGYRFRYDHDLYGRDRRYLNWRPSAKSLKREKAKLSAMTASRQGWKMIPELIEEIIRRLQGWMNYFRLGYPRQSFRAIGWHVRCRFISHLRRRSQRPYRKPEERSWYAELAALGLLRP